MKRKPSSRRRRNSTKSVLRLPDLEHAKAARKSQNSMRLSRNGFRGITSRTESAPSRN